MNFYIVHILGCLYDNSLHNFGKTKRLAMQLTCKVQKVNVQESMLT